MLRIHTDARSAKVEELTALPQVAMLVYEPVAKVQLRLDCTTVLHRAGDIWNRAWAATRPFSRKCYQVLSASGTAIASPEDALFASEATDDGAAHFLVIEATVYAFEWLYLAASGHRRARFEWRDAADGGSAGWQGTWLVP